MTPDFNQRVRQIFDQALDRPEAQRESFLQGACAADPTLFEAVNRLLRARTEADSFLEATLDHRIGRYLIRGELGRGAMGVVYDAVDPMIGRRVAVKMISLKAGTDASEAEFMKERLFREARSAGRLFHPGIVIILDVGLHDESAFITMELIEGESLHHRISQGPLDPKTALDILKQAAAALDYAHQQGVVHRDIKPANIMLQNKVTVKVADFGIAKLMSQNATMTGMLMGTPSYMSPEQIEAQPVDGRSDQFSLAVVAYELLTGARPFLADSMPTVAHLIVYGPRPSAAAARPGLPAAIDQVLERALSRMPADRFANCSQFTAALEQALLASPPLPTQTMLEIKPEPAAPVPAPRRRPTPFLYLGGIAVLLIAVIGVAALIYKNSLVPKRVAASSTPAQIASSAPAQVVVTKPSPAAQPSTPVPPPPAASTPAEAPAPTPPPKTSMAAKAAAAKIQEPKFDPNAQVPASFRAQEYFHAGEAKLKENKPEDALELFRQSADLGDINAMIQLGEVYQNGDGVDKNGTEAERWYLQASNKGSALAMVYLGAMYRLGDGVAEDYERAAQFFQKAADLKNPAAMFNLATMYEEGRGVPRSADKAKRLYQDAAALGNIEAQRRLAELQGRK
jgi:serine/threonine protein kinase